MAELMTFDSDDFTIEVSADGALYLEMDGVTGFNINPSPAPTREVRTFKAVTTVRGKPGPGEATFDIGNFLPHLEFWSEFRKHLSSGALLRFRTTSKAEQVLLKFTTFAEKSINVTTAGVATFAGSDPIDYDAEFSVGNVLIWDNEDGDRINSIVNKINSPTSVEIRPKPLMPSDPATGFSVVLPSIRREVRGRVTDMNTDNLSEGGSLANAVSIALSAIPGDWQVV